MALRKTPPCPISSMGFRLSSVEHNLRALADGDHLRIPVEELPGASYEVSCEDRGVFIKPLSGPFLGDLEILIVQFFGHGEELLTLPKADDEATMTRKQWDELWTKNPTNIVFIDAS